MKTDIFEDMKDCIGCHVSDLPYRKREVWEEIKRQLPLTYPKEQLETVFSKILEVRIDNTRTRTKWMEAEELFLKTPEENFADFFEKMQGRTMDPEEETLILQILEEAREDE